MSAIPAMSRVLKPTSPADTLIERVSSMAKQQSILVVEDESDLARLLRHNIEREGYKCRVAADGQKALAEMEAAAPDLILLDRMLPELSGDEVIARVRRDPRLAATPILMLTAKADEADELVGFALGADDYVSKPFSMKLVLARIAALLRRRDNPNPQAETELLRAGPIHLDLSRYELTVDGEPVSLTATELRLLKTLMAADGRVLTRARLIDSVMGMGIAVTDRTIDVHVTALRRKLGDAASWVQTIRGIGYTFRPPT